jgi:hypothetical protein
VKVLTKFAWSTQTLRSRSTSLTVMLAPSAGLLTSPACSVVVVGQVWINDGLATAA